MTLRFFACGRISRWAESISEMRLELKKKKKEKNQRKCNTYNTNLYM